MRWGFYASPPTPSVNMQKKTTLVTMQKKRTGRTEAFSQDIVAFLNIRRKRTKRSLGTRDNPRPTSGLGTPVNRSVRKGHAERSLGTPHSMEAEDKRRYLDRAHHSPSSFPRNHNHRSIFPKICRTNLTYCYLF